jgi:ABC-type Mn2+/Zn2+ transport system permease subunit
MIAVSAAVAVTSGVIGIYASYHLRTAAGASIVVAILVMYVLAAATGSLRDRQIVVRGDRVPARR